MKKTLIYLLALSMILSSFMMACNKPSNEEDKNATENNEENKEQGGENNEENNGEEQGEEKNNEDNKGGEEAQRPTEPKGQLIIGDGTEMSGDFSGVWQNNAVDANIRRLVQGSGTSAYNENGEVILNETVVEKYETKDNPDKTKTFRFTIKDGLKYNDGDAITAKDYVSDFLFWGSAVVGTGYAGGKNTSGIDCVGYEEYSSGKTNKFKGIHLVDDKTFEVTLAADRLPYFYDLYSASAGPCQTKFWLGKTIDVKDDNDGNGAYFAENIVTKEYAAAIKKARDLNTLPSTGPYKIEKFDMAQKMCTLVINENYAGDARGLKPLIAKLIFKKVDDKTALDDLKTGGVDLITQQAAGEVIKAGLDLTEDGKFAYSEYPRAGYGKLAFACDFGPTQYKEVRQAIAYLLDRNEFAKQFTGGFGVVANGPWGDAQWFWQEAKADLASKLNTYPYDPAKAVELLKQAGYTLNDKGAEYKEGDGVRYKKEADGKLSPLVIKWASSENNPVSELLVTKLVQNPDLIKAGMKIERDTMTFPELLGWLYRDGSEDAKYKVPTYNMFNLGTSFTPIYDLKENYTTDKKLLEMGSNTNFILNKDLEAAAIAMVKRPGDDKAGFLEEFKKFAVLWNDLLPDLPLYSNLYHDFYNSKLKNYHPTAIKQIDLQLLESWVEE